MTYTYTNKTSEPGLTNIHSDIAASTMTDKAIAGCTWHIASEVLEVDMQNELSSGDKSKLDTIVTDNS